MVPYECLERACDPEVAGEQGVTQSLKNLIFDQISVRG